MPLFASEEDVYAHLGRLFEEMVADPEIGPQLQRADTIVQYRYREPEATITIDLRCDSQPRVDLGATDLEPELVMSMAADTANGFFLGQVNITLAVARGWIKPKGSVAKFLKLVPVVKQLVPRYEAQLKAEGRTDLVEGVRVAP